MKYDRLNFFAAVIIGIVALIPSFRSCQISANVASNNDQIDTLAGIAATTRTSLQQVIHQSEVLSRELLEIQRQNTLISTELEEMKQQSNLISKEYSEMKNVDKGISKQTGKISEQLGYSKIDQIRKVHQDSLFKKSELLNLRKEKNKLPIALLNSVSKIWLTYNFFLKVFLEIAKFSFIKN